MMEVVQNLCMVNTPKISNTQGSVHFGNCTLHDTNYQTYFLYLLHKYCSKLNPT